MNREKRANRKRKKKERHCSIDGGEDGSRKMEGEDRRSTNNAGGGASAASMPNSQDPGVHLCVLLINFGLEEASKAGAGSPCGHFKCNKWNLGKQCFFGTC